MVGDQIPSPKAGADVGSSGEMAAQRVRAVSNRMTHDSHTYTDPADWTRLGMSATVVATGVFAGTGHDRHTKRTGDHTRSL